MRDDFSKRTIDLLAKRAGYLCSNPECNLPTVGAAASPDKSIIVGEAAHITAAAPGGPRYDPSLTAEQRRHHSNGIWLCEIHGKAVDADPNHFTVEMLRKWKQQAEQKSFRAIVALSALRDTEPTTIAHARSAEEENLSSIVDTLIEAARTDLEGFKREGSWPRHAVALNLRMNDGKVARAFDIAALAEANRTFSEIVVVAPPGTGKTTTLLQLAEATLGKAGSVAVFVPLGEWSSQSCSLFASVAGRHSFSDVTEADLKRLALASRLALILDGWNELDAPSRRRATSEVKSLQREFPALSLIVSTRRQALDVPISGPIVEIDALTADQQLEIARGLRGSEGEVILDQAWRTAGIRDLVAIPLYLTTLLSRAAGSSLPTTKEEVLRLFVEEHEKPADKADALRETLYGFHTEMLRALAVEATQKETTALAENAARAVIKTVEDQLLATKQISEAPQPMAVVDVLVSHHMLVRLGSGISFQHQQFQEWYASFDVEALMRKAIGSDHASRERLRKEVLNEYAWEEPILFACERASRADHDGVQAVAAAIVETMGIDPMLAAEMIYRSGGSVWEQIKAEIVDSVLRWHRPGKVDRAVRFMITAGRSDFAAQVWELISSADDQVYLEAFRIARRFRPSVLGDGIEARIAGLPEKQRGHIISELVMESGPDGIELGAQLAQGDASPVVKVSAIEALQFRRADRLLVDILKTAPDEVWVQLALDGYTGEIAGKEAATRLAAEQEKLVNVAGDPVSKIRVLLKGTRNGLSAGSEIASQIENSRFPGNDQQAGWLLAEAYKLYPKEVARALLHRLEAGLEIPFRTEEILQADGMIVDDGPLAELVVRPETLQRIAIDACTVVGPTTVGTLIDTVMQMDAEIRAPEARPNEPAREQYRHLIDRISATNTRSFVEAVLKRSGTNKPEEIRLLAELLSGHGKREDRKELQVSEALRKELIATVAGWAEILLSSDRSSRYQLAEVARVIERLATPDLIPVLNRMLTEDLTRWRKTREEFLASVKQKIRTRRDAQMCYRPQYGRAFAAIGTEAVVELMKSYLPDLGFYGFGADAAGVLKSIWDRQQQTNAGKPFISGPDFSAVKGRRIERQKQGTGTKFSGFAEMILAVVRDVIRSGTSDEAHNHALELACIAFAMPYGDETQTIETLLRLPQPLRTKQKLFTVLVLAGEIISSELVLDGIRALAEQSKKNQWFSLDNEWWEWESWLKLIPFSDKPAATLDALELLGPKPLQPWRLRGVLAALGYAPSPDAEDVLRILPRKNAAFLGEYDWINALERRSTTVAARTLVEFICEGAFATKPGGIDGWTLYRKIAAAIRMDNAFRAEVYERYEREGCSGGSAILEQAIAEAADEAGVLLLIENHARHGRPFSGLLHSAIHHVCVGERPSEDWVGAVVSFSIDVSGLRKTLFGMTGEGTAEAKLATECLKVIDDLRDEYGAAESEPRHPDIATGRPWPIL